jgi:hypothetical protein
LGFYYRKEYKYIYPREYNLGNNQDRLNWIVIIGKQEDNIIGI